MNTNKILDNTGNIRPFVAKGTVKLALNNTIINCLLDDYCLIYKRKQYKNLYVLTVISQGSVKEVVMYSFIKSLYCD